jgi:hypothetical protein
MGNYAVSNGDGTICNAGFTLDRARAVAQERANERRESFFVQAETGADESDFGEEFAPEAV